MCQISRRIDIGCFVFFVTATTLAIFLEILYNETISAI